MNHDIIKIGDSHIRMSLISSIVPEKYNKYNTDSFIVYLSGTPNGIVINKVEYERLISKIAEWEGIAQ